MKEKFFSRLKVVDSLFGNEFSCVALLALNWILIVYVIVSGKLDLHSYITISSTGYSNPVWFGCFSVVTALSSFFGWRNIAKSVEDIKYQKLKTLFLIFNIIGNCCMIIAGFVYGPKYPVRNIIHWITAQTFGILCTVSFLGLYFLLMDKNKFYCLQILFVSLIAIIAVILMVVFNSVAAKFTLIILITVQISILCSIVVNSRMWVCRKKNVVCNEKK
ncbi:MAG: hypothetical protein LBU60_03480 [Clostridiales bacterium]|jgi:hypothetical protein|nr:hypothetical protein [Clostridiales bacterium]